MTLWKHVLRLGLALVVVGVSAAVLLNLRERAETVRADAPLRDDDPDVVIRTVGSNVLRTDGIGDNISVKSGQQRTYADGALRMTDGVEVVVAARDGRGGFNLHGHSAEIDAGQTELSVSGGVRLEADDNLQASTEAARYSEADGMVHMPGAADFVRGGMQASAASARYDRAAGILQLSSAADVTLAGEGETPTAIRAGSATVAQADGYMAFGGGVSVAADGLRMAAPRAHVDLVPDSARITSLALRGGAEITGSEPGAGQLRTMTAAEISLAYGADGAAVEAAALTGGAALALAGGDAGPGSKIGAASMEVGFAADGGGIRGLAARGGVVLELPAAAAAAGQRIEANRVEVDGLSGGGAEQARFTGGVEYREPGAADDAARVARAERLEATLGGGLAALEAATFRGGVTFEDGGTVGRGGEARYLIAENAVELAAAAEEEDAEPAAEEAGQAPRVVYESGSVSAETIRIGFDGPRIDARGGVESVLQPGGADGDGSAEYPDLLDAVESLLVTAGELSYDGAARRATYAGGALLWQGETTFRGGTLVLDEATGNLSLDGNAETRFALGQVNRETADVETAFAAGSAGAMRYEQELHRATYSDSARLDGPQGDLQADEIELQLLSDNTTVERVTATGSVRLLTSTRVVSGEKLVYHDATGRYEMEGQPVTFVERVDDQCRSTQGRTLTFFAAAAGVAVDGQSQFRTATATGDCPANLSR